MASETTPTQKESQTIIEPREDQLRERLGFDRRGIRREFAGVTSLGMGDKYVEQEDRRFIDPGTIEMPYGPSEMGETGGSGMRMFVEEGDAWQTYRFHHGFSVLEEDLEQSEDTVAQQRDEVVEIFDFFFDSMFLTGVEDRSGNTIKKGMFQWLKDNIPANRTFDCENYDGDTGDEDLTDAPENILKFEAYSEVSGNLLNDRDAQWDVMVGRQPALANFNKVDETAHDRMSYWDRLSDDNAIGGVSDWNTIPDDLEYPYTPSDRDPLTVDLTSELTNDEVLLLPDMDAVRENFWRLHEVSEPESYPRVHQGGGRYRQDFAARYTHEFNPKGHKRFADAEDAIHLKNVSALFN